MRDDIQHTEHLLVFPETTSDVLGSPLRVSNEHRLLANRGPEELLRHEALRSTLRGKTCNCGISIATSIPAAPSLSPERRAGATRLNRGRSGGLLNPTHSIRLQDGVDRLLCGCWYAVLASKRDHLAGKPVQLEAITRLKVICH
jgi:hypothetical protein